MEVNESLDLLHAGDDDYPDVFSQLSDTERTGDSDQQRSISVTQETYPYTMQRNQDATPAKARGIQATWKGLPTTEDQEIVKLANTKSDKHGKTDVLVAKKIRGGKNLHRRNVFFLCGGVFFTYVTFQAEQNLQSSLNSEGGSGVLGLSLVYASVAFTALFLAPAVIRRAGPKPALIFSSLAFGAFTLANAIGNPTMLLAVAGLVGTGMGLLWPSHFKILTNSADAYGEITGRTRDQMITRFNGIFFTVFVSTNIWGNLASSLLLSGHDNDRKNVCAPDSDTTVRVSAGQRQALMVVFAVCNLLSFIMFFCMRAEKGRGWTDTEDLSKERALSLFMFMKKNSVAALSLFRNIDMISLAPIALMIGFQKAFVYGDFNQYFVSQCLGIGQVGYAMVCFGVCNVVNSVIAARVAEKFGRIVVVLTGAVIALTILQFLLHWSREPNKSLLFVIGGLWGIVDASFNQQLTALFGVIFRGLHQEASFANLVLCQAIGLGLSFGFSGRFHGCLGGVRLKMYILSFMIPFSMILYLMVEWRLRKRKKAASLEVSPLEENMSTA